MIMKFFLLIQDEILLVGPFLSILCRVVKVCAFVYRFSDFLKVTIILTYIRHVRIKGFRKISFVKCPRNFQNLTFKALK